MIKKPLPADVASQVIKQIKLQYTDCLRLAQKWVCNAEERVLDFQLQTTTETTIFEGRRWFRLTRLLWQDFCFFGRSSYCSTICLTVLSYDKIF